MSERPLFLGYIGRDFYTPRGWGLWFAVLPRQDLMTRASDPGRVLLAALSIRISWRWGFPDRARITPSTPKRWCLRMECWNDVGEITTRVAQLAGQL